jgi:hypothetical protein
MKTLLIPLGTFAAGVALGFTVHGAITVHRFQEVRISMRNPDSVLGSLSHRLDLAPDQQQKVLLLLRAQMPKTEALRNEQRAKFKALRASFDAQLRPLLAPDQQKKLDAMVADWEKHEKDERGPDCSNGPVSAAAPN